MNTKKKGAVFEWSEIQPRVEQAVYEFFAEELVTRMEEKQ